MDKRRLGDVVDLFTNIQMIEHGSEKDILGRTYEYCLSMFAEQEGKRGGEFFTPSCVVRTLVEVLKPFKGRVYDVEVVTCGFTKQVVSTFGVTVTIDKTIDEIIVDDYNALAIPGGFEEYDFYSEAFDQRLSDLIVSFEKSGKYIASVCVGALAIAKAGILRNRMATTYHLGNGQRQKQLSEYGAVVVNEPIVVDGNIITSWCPQTAPYVALKLLEMMIGKEKSDIIKDAMGF